MKTLFERLKSGYKLKLQKEAVKYPAVCSRIERVLNENEYLINIKYDDILFMYDILDIKGGIHAIFDLFEKQ